jgi:hypothetical protein
MCMEYEKEYRGRCWDHMFIGDYPESVEHLLRQYGAELNDAPRPRDTARADLFALFEKWHEQGIMRPVTP